MDFISSPSNFLVKQCIRLDKKRERESSGLFLIEGLREIQLASKSGIVIQHLIFNSKWQEADRNLFEQEIPAQKYTQFSDEVFSKVSYRDSVANALAICVLNRREINDLVLPQNALVLILESLEKPGNIGAIFRSADAVGVDAIILANPVVDMFNANLIRSSLGSLFTVPSVKESNEVVHDWLRKHNFNIVATWLEASSDHFSADYSGNTAIVMGSEAFGISEFWQEKASQCVKIPMQGEVDSMNVSTAAAVMMYEAYRQRL